MAQPLWEATPQPFHRRETPTMRTRWPTAVPNMRPERRPLARRGGSPPAIDGYLEGVADLEHAVGSQPAEPFDEHRHRHALDRVEVDRGPLRDRVVVRFQRDLAREAADGRRAGCHQRSS